MSIRQRIENQSARSARRSVLSFLVALVLAVSMVPPLPAHAADSSDLVVLGNEEVQAMYRLYNPNSGEHFYTASEGERDSLVNAGWSYEGVGWEAPVASQAPVFRLYSGTDHHYTLSEGERDALVAVGWSYEGIGWYSDEQERVPLYRQFNPNVNPAAPTNNSGSHNYTTDLNEHNSLVSLGWQGEGIGWYAVAEGHPVTTTPGSGNGQGSAGSMTYQPDVKTVDGGWSVTDGSSVRVSSPSSTYGAGDIVVFEPTAENPMGHVLKVTSATESGPDIVYTGTTPSASEVIDTLTASGVSSSGVLVEPKDDVEMETSGLVPMAWKGTEKLVSLDFKIKKTGLKLSLEPELDYLVDFSWGKLKELKIAVNFETKVSGSIKADSSKGDALKTDLCDLYFPTSVPSLWFKVEVSAKFTVSGEVELAISNVTTAGFRYKNDDFKPIFDSKNDIGIEVSAEAKAGIGAECGVTVLGTLDLATVESEYGTKLQGKVDVRSPEMTCTDLKSSTYGEIGASLVGVSWSRPFPEIKFGTIHWENGKRVKKCTWASEDAGSSTATPASDFEYIIGNPLEDLKRQGADIEYWGHGCGYTYGISHVSEDEVNGRYEGGDGFDCGYGVYINDYIGDDASIVVPRQIDGVDVVCVSICEGRLSESDGGVVSERTIDVSSCDGLKALTVWDMGLYKNNLTFGANPNLENLFFGICSLGDLNLSGLTGLEDVCFAQGVTYDSLIMGSNKGKDRYYS